MEEKNKEITMPSTTTGGIIAFGLFVVFTIFGAFGGWAAYAPLASSSVAMGKVSADLDKKTIQHLEGGIIDNIYVKNGDFVKKGQILLKLKDVQIKAQLKIMQSQYQDKIALYARLKAQRDNLSKIIFPKELKNQEIIKDQKNIFATNKKSLQDEKTITNKRKKQLKNQIDGLGSLIKSRKNRLVSIKQQSLEWEELYQQRLVDKLKIQELKREKNRIDGDVANTKAEIAKLKEQISELDTQQLLREKSFKKEVLQKLVETKSGISDLKSKIIAIEDTLTRTKVIAPVSGTIMGFELHTIGGVISPARPILEIVPTKSNSQLLVVTQVQTKDIDKVKVGLSTEVMFTAFDMRQTHPIDGKVIYLSADTFIDKASGMPYYEAKIEITKKGLEQLKEYKFKLVTGMPAQIMIKLDDRTALSYLIKPFMDMVLKGFNEE